MSRTSNEPWDLAGWTAPRRATIDAALTALFSDSWPAAFGAMCRYPLLTGGKRIRPLLVLAAFEANTGSAALGPALAPAVAIELIHSYSLVHDDLPCMDDDDLRRGQPTVHVRYGEANAVLVGDALLTEAFRVLARGEDLPARVRLQLVDELSEAAGYPGMIGGQARDTGVGGPVTDPETLLRLHRGKTGALIRCAVRMGAIAGRASADQLAALTTFAEAVGLAFQLADDLLDLDQDAGADGPPSLPKLLGAEETRRRALALRDDALAALVGLPRSEPLRALAHFTVDRPS